MNICNISKFGIYDSRNDQRTKHVGQYQTLKDYQIEFFIEADKLINLNGIDYLASPGTVFIGKPGATKKNELPYKCFFIHLRFDEQNNYSKLLDSLPEFYFIIDKTKYSKIFEELITHLSVHSPWKMDDYMTGKLLELFYFLRTDAEKNKNFLKNNQKSENSYITKSLQFIDENYCEKIKLEDMARESGYTVNYFNSIFSKTIGKTPIEYLNDMKLDKAKELLSISTLSILDISERLGFASQSYFNFVFKKKTGITPNKYRKMMNDRNK